MTDSIMTQWQNLAPGDLINYFGQLCNVITCTNAVRSTDGNLEVVVTIMVQEAPVSIRRYALGLTKVYKSMSLQATLTPTLATELEDLCERIEDAGFGSLDAQATVDAIRFLIDGHKAEDVDLGALGDDYL